MGSPIGTAASLLASRAIFLRRPLPPLVTASGLGLALFLLAGAAEGAPDPRCGGDPEFTFCPNLVAGPLTVSLADRGRALQVSDQVTNKGNRDAPPTSFQVIIAGRTFPSQQLASVPLNDPVQVETTVLVPADLRGGPKTVSLTVDPANGVGEFDEADNTAAADVFLPALPDLRVDTVRLTVTRGGTAIAVEALVKNAGGAASRRATTLAMSASGTTRT